MSPSNDYKLPAFWEKAKIISTLIASVLIPLVIAVIGHAYTGALKHNEIGVRYVELAVGILSEKPEPDDQKIAVRKWAIDIINLYSAVPLSEPAIKQLEENQILKHRLRQMEETYSTLEKAVQDKHLKPIENIR